MNRTKPSYTPCKAAYSDILEPLEAFLLQELAQLVFRFECLLLFVFAPVFPIDTVLVSPGGSDIGLI